MNDLRPCGTNADYLILTVGPLQALVPHGASEQLIDVVRASLARINASNEKRAAMLQVAAGDPLTLLMSSALNELVVPELARPNWGDAAPYREPDDAPDVPRGKHWLKPGRYKEPTADDQRAAEKRIKARRNRRKELKARRKRK